MLLLQRFSVLKRHLSNPPRRNFQDTEDILYGLWVVKAAIAAKRRKLHKLLLLDRTKTPQPNGMRTPKSPEDKELEQELKKIEEEAVERGIPVEFTDRRRLSHYTGDRPHQGVVLVASPLDSPKILSLTKTLDSKIPHSKEKLWKYEVVCRDGSRVPVESTGTKPPVWLALDQIMDPQNFGAILRTAHFFGVQGVVRCQRESAPLSSVVSKASSGVLELMDVYSSHNLSTFLQDSANSGWDTVATTISPTSGISVGELAPTKPTIVVMGNEGEGLRPKILRHCSTRVMIPMLQKTPAPGEPQILDSLNVSVAAGIILYQLNNPKK